MYGQGYGTPPPRRGSGQGCLIAVGVLVAAGGVGIVLLAAVLGSGDPKKRAEREAVDEAIAASAQRANEERLAELKADLRKKCGIKDGGAVFFVEQDDMKRQCREIVKEGLEAPSSAEFPPIDDPGGGSGLVTDDGCRMTYASYVEALNPLGVKLRTRFSCTFEPRTGKLDVKMTP